MVGSGGPATEDGLGGRRGVVTGLTQGCVSVMLLGGVTNDGSMPTKDGE